MPVVCQQYKKQKMLGLLPQECCYLECPILFSYKPVVIIHNSPESTGCRRTLCPFQKINEWTDLRLICYLILFTAFTVPIIALNIDKIRQEQSQHVNSQIGANDTISELSEQSSPFPQYPTEFQDRQFLNLLRYPFFLQQFKKIIRNRLVLQF